MPKRSLILVDVIKAKSGQVQIDISAQGTVSPRTQTILISEVSGLITKVSPAFVAGGFFARGDILVQIDDRNYRADVKRALASVATAQTIVTREAGLADYAQADWERAKSILQSSKAASDLALRKPQLAEAIANLEFAKAELDKRQGDLERTIIRAPYDGLVREKRADVGQYVAAGTQIAVTFAVDIAEIRLPLPDGDLPFLNLDPAHLNNQTGPNVTLSAEIGGIVHNWEGKIVRTEGVFDERSRVLYLVAQVIDPYNQKKNHQNQSGNRWDYPLRIGTFVNAKIKGKLEDNIIKLPRRVLRHGDEVWIVGDNNELIPRKIKVLRFDKNSIYVSAGINDNELVCLTTLDNPLPGSRVKFEAPIETLIEVTASTSEGN